MNTLFLSNLKNKTIGFSLMTNNIMLLNYIDAYNQHRSFSLKQN